MLTYAITVYLDFDGFGEFGEFGESKVIEEKRRMNTTAKHLVGTVRWKISAY